MKGTIELGDIAKDKITGFSGVVTCITTWLNGCIRMNLQPETLKDGKPGDQETFDIQQLELVKKRKIDPPTTRPGGPKPAAKMMPSPRGMR